MHITSTTHEFLKSFVNEQIGAFESPIERSDELLDLRSLDVDRYLSLMDVVDRYAYNDCHHLTLAMAESLGLKSVLCVFNSGGTPVHSAISSKNFRYALDSNGVHKQVSMKERWSATTGEECRLVTLPISEFAVYCMPDEEEMAIAMENFELISDFISNQMVTKNASIDGYEPDEYGLPF